MKLYFAYGANLNKLDMRRRCPDAVEVMPFYLDDYRLMFSGVASIQPCRDEFVAGALWAISEQDEKNLDGFEGYPTMYRKETVQVDGMDIMFYRMNSEVPYEPSLNYVMTISQGYQDWALDIGHLHYAIEQTQENAYDLHRSTNRANGLRTLDTILENDLYYEPGDDLCWIRDDRYTTRYHETDL